MKYNEHIVLKNGNNKQLLIVMLSHHRPAVRQLTIHFYYSFENIHVHMLYMQSNTENVEKIYANNSVYTHELKNYSRYFVEIHLFVKKNQLFSEKQTST